MTTKLIILLAIGLIVLGLLVWMIVRAWRYRKDHPDAPMGTGLRMFLCAILLFNFHFSTFNSAQAQSSWQGGHGAPNNPYRIRKANELVAFANCLATGNEFYFYRYGYSKEYICSPTPPTSGDYDTIPAHGEGRYFLIPNDIILNEGNVAACDGEIDPSWTVWPETGVFKGYLLGDMHTISGLYIDRPETTVGVGFFSKMEGNAHVEKLGIVNSYVRGGAGNIGGMVGELSGGRISDCFFEGSIRTSGNNVGGFIGLMTLHDTLLPEISVCFASGHVDCSGDYVAGLVGKVEKGTVRQCYSSMAVRTTDVVGIALSGANPTHGGIGTDEDIASHHVGGIYGYALSPTGTNSYDPDVDSIRVDTCYFDWQLSDLPSIPGSSWVPADWRDNRGAAALSTYDMTYYSQMYFDIKNQRPSLWKSTYLCNLYPYPDPFNDPIKVTYRLELDYPQDSNVLATLIPFLDVSMKPNDNGQSTINNMNDQERKHMKLSDLTESFVLWKKCDSLGISTWTVDNLWPDAVRREFYAPDNSWNVYLQKQGVVRFTIEAAGRTRYYDAVVNIPPYVGSAENPFLISNLEDIIAFRNGINAGEDFVYHRFLIRRDSLPHIHWMQTADIDLAAAGDWVAIGKNADTCFTGFYDGQGHKLMNLTMTNGTDRALFIYSKGDIKNLVIEDPHINGCGGSSAALATNVMGGSFENCAATYSPLAISNSTTQTLTFSGDNCAALVGSVESATEDTVVFSGCFNSCTVSNTGSGNAAGIVGSIQNSKFKIQRCFNTGDITASGNVHPIVATILNSQFSILNSYNAGVLTGTQVDAQSTNTSFFNDYHVSPLCNGATKVATRYFIDSTTLVRPYLGDSYWLYEEGRYPRLRWTDSSTARLEAIAACTPRLPMANLPLPDTMTVANAYNLLILCNGVNTNASFRYDGYLLPAFAQDIVFSLTANIALGSNNSDWSPIGYTVPGSGDEGHFAGVFLGNDHTISNLQTSQRRPVAGLFGRLTGRVADLRINLGTLSATEYAGGVCAILDGGRLERCYVMGGNIESDYIAGGIAAIVRGADSLTTCMNFASVIGNHSVGGLVGQGGHVLASANFGDVTGMPASIYTGGISGHSTTVEKSFNSGLVTARPSNPREDNWVGGLIGYSDTTILYCYNAGVVNGANRKYTGGICGYGKPQYCYVSGTTRSTGTHLGSIVGASVAGVSHCCYDNQMSPPGGIDGHDTTGKASGLPTAMMLSTQLGNTGYPNFLGTPGAVWYYSTNNNYPQLVALRNNAGTIAYSIASTVPIKLSNDETYDNVVTHFTRGNGNWSFLVGGTPRSYTNCLSLLNSGVIPNVNVIAQSKGIAWMVLTAGEGKICRKVQLWVNLDDDFALEVSSQQELEFLRQIIFNGEGYYYYNQPSGNRYTTDKTPNNTAFIEIVDGGQDLRFKLTTDIRMNNSTWYPLGTPAHPFRGTFDGNSHRVSYFRVLPFNSSEAQENPGHCGFFGYIEGGTVHDLILDSVLIQAILPHQGALCGYNSGGTISNCLVRNGRIQLQGEGEGIGLVCGTNRYGNISHCQVNRTNSASFYNNSFCIPSGGDKLGGICGHNAFGTIDSCQVDSLTVNSTTIANRVGGVVGYNEGGSVVANRINNSDLTNITGSYVGGIAGASDGYSVYNHAIVSNCHLSNTTVNIPNATAVGGVVGSASGEYSSISGITMSDTVYGDSVVGGIVGLLQDATVDSCWNQSYVRAKRYCVGGIVGMMNSQSGVVKCYNTGIVGNSVEVDYVGGIVGMMNDECSVSSSFSSGVVKGRNQVGGLVGRMRDGSYFTDCYNTGIVNGIALVGGLVGLQKDPTVASGYGYSAGWVEGASMTGAVCGYTTDTTMLHDLHYDRQLCAYKGVCHIDVQSAEGVDVTGITAHPSSEMTSITFGDGRPWEEGTASMYPRLTALVGSGADSASALALQIGNAYDLAPDTTLTLPSCTGAAWYAPADFASISENTLTASGRRGLIRLSARTAGGIDLRSVQLALGISEARPIEITNSTEFGNFRNLISYSSVAFYYDTVGKQFYNLNTAAINHILPQCIVIAPGGAGYHFKLTADVTVGNWTPVGIPGYPFFGHFDGGGHKVNITSFYAGYMSDCRGLFGAMMGRVKNLVVDNTAVRGNYRVGALAGYCSGSVSRCGTNGLAAVEADTAVGGLVGEASYSQFFDCWNGMRVYGQRTVGGIVGKADNTTIRRCFNYGLITGDTAVGGLAGALTGQCLVNNCYNTGAVKGEGAVDALAGVVGEQCSVAGCYNAGYIVGPALQTPDYFNDKQMNPRVDERSLLTSEIIGDGLRSQLGDTYWSYHAGEYPRLKSLDTTAASVVSVKSLALDGKMPTNSIVREFRGDTSSGIVWNRYGTGTALRIPNTVDSNGVFTLANCGADTLQATLSVGGRTYARLIPVVVMSASDVNIDTIYACGSFTWTAADGQTYTDEGFHSWVAPGAQCGEAQAIDLRFAPVPISVNVSKSDACSDSYWSKYGHNVGTLKATATGGYTGSYTYEWSKVDGTIGDFSFVAGHPDSLHNLTYGDYVITVNDSSTPYCTVRDTVNIDEFSFNYLVTKWGNCVNTADGWIEVMLRQFEFNRDGSPYTIECWDSNHHQITIDTILALNPPDESGVPKGYDTIFNLANGLYYLTITDRLGCYQDKQIKVNDPINPKMTLRAKGFKKVYDGIPVSLNSINVVEYDDNWKVPERAEYYVTSDEWRQMALRTGDSLIVSLANPDMLIKDVDSVRNVIDGWSIKDAETGKDKTCLYHFYPIDSCIVILPATLTLFTGSETKEYDGTELTSYNNWNVEGLQNGEHVLCMPSASLTDVGSIPNTYYIDWGNPGPWDENIAKQGNYTVINHFGTLTVTPNTQPVTITAGSASKAYDGTALTNNTFTYSGLPAGFYVEATTSGSRTDVGDGENVVSNYVIRNSNGEDKTAFFVNVTLVPGTLTVNPIGVDITVGNGTWHALSSPMHDGGQTYQSPANVTHLKDADYDLFRYDEEYGTWENEKVHHYNFEQGRGYIYRRVTAATLTFTGQPHSGNIGVDLSAICSDTALRGFNLVGNPYNHTTTMSEACYTLCTDGAWTAHAAGYEVAIGEAVLVHTGSARTLEFTEGGNTKGTGCRPDITFTISDMGHKDVVYAVLSDGEGLPKVSHLEADLPTLYIPVEERRYAVAMLGDDIEAFPLTFKAAPGDYTLSIFNSQFSILNYLHLIDKIAGRDIDLLRDSTYTFRHSSNQAITDRFLIRLTPELNTEHLTLNTPFAHWDGDRLVIEGSGTLEAYDIMGRRLFTEEVSGFKSQVSKAAFPRTGVYILRLNGQSQKIIIK